MRWSGLFEKHARAERGAPFRRGDQPGGRARGRPAPRWKIRGAYVGANVTGALNVLEMCRKFEVKKFVLASTSSLYGKGPSHAVSRGAEHRPGQLSPYAATKKAAEAMSYTYHYLHKIDVSVLRYFTVYGPAGAPGHDAPCGLCNGFAKEKPLTIFGDGSQSRDFTFVDDIARGTIAALRPLGYEVINLGSGPAVCD